MSSIFEGISGNYFTILNNTTPYIGDTPGDHAAFTIIIAFASTGCDLCLNKTLGQLSMIPDEIRRQDVQVILLGYGTSSDLGPTGRGLLAENANIFMGITSRPVPIEWNHLERPHLLLYSNPAKTILLDLELSNSKGDELNAILDWIDRLIKADQATF